VADKSKRARKPAVVKNKTKEPADPAAHTKTYSYPTETTPLRPDIGTQAQFRKRKPPAKYSYDSSLSPAMDWDGKNWAREQGERLINEILSAPTLETARDAALQLKRLSTPFLNWAGKAEHLSFDVPSLPLFVHERLSTSAILETLRGHRHDAAQMNMFDLFGDPQRSVSDQILKPYEHGPWQNRMILGDSLVVMNSLLEYEGMGGKVQMIYMDPPYGVKFGSNFQPFVRKRDVVNGDDDDLTREPEMVQAYRDTWELGPHSYLTYLRDRLKLARDLLTTSGSIFVQISSENLHHVREVLDEVFGLENFCSVVTFSKTSGATSDLLPSVADYLVWYARDISRVKYNQLYVRKEFGGDGAGAYTRLQLPDGSRRSMTAAEKADHTLLPAGSKIFRIDNLTSQRPPGDFPVEFRGNTYRPRRGYWKTGVDGMSRLIAANRLESTAAGLYYVRYLDDFPMFDVTNLWEDTGIAGFASDKLYVVETSSKVVARCILMTTDPGDLVFDPTCGSGTAAHIAEQWGRRWITCDVSRVPLALARQRLLSSTFPYYELSDDRRGPSGGFVYRKRQNKRGEEVGGIVPHVKLKAIANSEPFEEEVLVDRPEIDCRFTRISGPFCFESTIPVPMDLEGQRVETAEDNSATFSDRMIEILRKSPVIRLSRNQSITLKNIRPPSKSLSLSAEGVMVNGNERTVAFVFGPENGAVSEALVYEAAREAHMKDFDRLLVIGFAAEAKARTLIESCEAAVGIHATYVQATPDLIMTDLLKNMRSSQIFSVCGLPEIALTHVKTEEGLKYQVRLLGLDTFDPVSMNSQHLGGNDVPAWLLDCDYNDLCFHVSQAFFPRTSAWENLKKALKATHQETVWDHLAGDTSAPFEAGERQQIAVKVIDDRGNELMVVKKLSEVEG